MASFVLASIDQAGTVDADSLATATAVSALAALRDSDPQSAPSLSIAVDRLLAALSGMQREEGLFDAPADRSDDQRAVVSAFIYYLLGSDSRFREVVRIFDLLDWFEQREYTLPRDAGEVWSLACAGSRDREPALAA
jgi:hypothetical protein